MFQKKKCSMWQTGRIKVKESRGGGLRTHFGNIKGRDGGWKTRWAQSHKAESCLQGVTLF